MAEEKDTSFDFYAVLGLKKECSEAELRNAYKKLAMKWHPDRFSASGNAGGMEKAKEKFQEIQNAYSVLSDSNMRLLYDFGVYDKVDDNDEEGMGDFIGEMAQLMSQTKSSCAPSIGRRTATGSSWLFVEMFHDDLDAEFSGRDFFPVASGASISGRGHKRGNLAANSGKGKLSELDRAGGGFCLGSNDAEQSSKRRGNKRSGRKQKASSS